MERSRLYPFQNVLSQPRRPVFIFTVLLGVLLLTFLFAYAAFAKDSLKTTLKHTSVVSMKIRFSPFLALNK